MKIFAFFLPQFHTIPENDEWWGKGFTEWTNVRRGRPLYMGHVQPKHPLDGWYYDLLEEETVRRQTELMHRYRVDGMIYYHYYFSGKLLLEKPAENLLRHPDIDQPFFFCWGNHNWYKSVDGKKQLLMEQRYGGEEDWERHFAYLLPFFRDPRYEKRDGKPLLMLFKSDFAEKNAMTAYFDRRCRESGLAGISVIEDVFDVRELDAVRANRSAQTDAIFLREANVSHALWKSIPSLHRVAFIAKRLCSKLPGKGPMVYDGNAIYDVMLRRTPLAPDLIRGIFFEWDNTVRHGRRGFVITPVDRERFMAYMTRLRGQEYVFVNAWNEWAEGMTLEPTEENGYRYLEWIRDAQEAAEHEEA